MSPTIIKEEKLQFAFGDSWSVQEYDGHGDYLEKIQKLSGSKAVDIVGLVCQGACFFIEIKDFRNYRIQNKKRIADGELAEEVAMKVRDSVGGLIGAHRMSSDPSVWEPFARALASRSRQLKVALWVEEDRAGKNPRKWKNSAKVLGNAIKKHVRWLTTKILVVNQHVGAGALPDLTVTNVRP